MLNSVQTLLRAIPIQVSRAGWFLYWGCEFCPVGNLVNLFPELPKANVAQTQIKTHGLILEDLETILA